MSVGREQQLGVYLRHRWANLFCFGRRKCIKFSESNAPYMWGRLLSDFNDGNDDDNDDDADDNDDDDDDDDDNGNDDNNDDDSDDGDDNDNYDDNDNDSNDDNDLNNYQEEQCLLKALTCTRYLLNRNYSFRPSHFPKW